MPEILVLVPYEADGDLGNRPKYADLEGVGDYSVKVRFDSPSRCIVLFSGSETVLERISDMEDSEVMTRAEAHRYIQESNGRVEQDSYRPPQPGQGDTIEERVDDFLDNVVGSTRIEFEGDSEFYHTKPYIQYPRPAFYPESNALLSLEEQRKFPKYLTDLLLRAEAAVLSVEHYEYWLYTARFLRNVLPEIDDFDQLTEPERLGRPVDIGYGGLVGDFQNLISIATIPRRLTNPDDRVNQFVRSVSGLGPSFDEHSALKLCGANSLAILDGLVTRHCSLNSDGNLENGTVEMTWRPDSPDGSGFGYHDRIQYWRHYCSSETTENTLSEIDDLNRYDLDYLRLVSGVVGNEEVLEDEIGSTNHFLRVLGRSQRNYSIHGEGSGPLIAPIALSLCCLVFWDHLDEETYEVQQDRILAEMGQT